MKEYLKKALEIRKNNPSLQIKEIHKQLKGLGIDIKYKTLQRGLYRHDFENEPKEVQGEEERKPKYEETDKGYTVWYGKKQRHKVFISFEDLEEAFNLYCIGKLTLEQTALKMNLTRREFYAIKTAFDITKSSMPFTPKQADYYDAEELAEKMRLKKKQYALTKVEENKHKDIENRVKQMDKTSYWHKEMCKIINKIDAVPYNNIRLKKSLEEIYVAYIADIHGGLTVDNYFNEYNIEIMHQRFNKLGQFIIDNVKSRDIVIPDLGDTVHGIIHGSVQKYSTWVTDAVMEVTKGYESLFLMLLKEGFRITFLKVNGSHDSVEKAKKERTEEESFGNIIYDALKWKYSEFENIKFIDRLKGLNMAILPLFDYSTLLIHGDNTGLNKLKEVDRLFKEYNVKEINAGHIHHRKVEDFNGLLIHYNEPFCGTDQYASNKFLSSEYGTRLVQYTPEGRGIEQLIRY